LRTEEMELIKHTVEDMKWPKGSVRNYMEHQQTLVDLHSIT
jgi:hypothetical protein